MKFNLILICLSFSIAILAQEKWNPDTAIQLSYEPSKVYVDHLNNIYTIDNSTIRKYNIGGEFLKEYNNPGLGSITYLNTFNPLLLLLYFEEYNKYVFLDNYLNENLKVFDPSSHGFYDIQLAATIDENSLWFYDQVSDKLHKWNILENVKQNSTLQMSQIAFTDGRPTFIWSTMKNVYLCYESVGIFEFDNFGGYIKTIPIRGIDHFQLRNSDIVYLSGSDIMALNLSTKADQVIFTLENGILDYSISEELLVTIKNQVLSIYSKP